MIAKGLLCYRPTPTAECVFQPASTALYGNRSWAADLASYEPDIMLIIGLPEPVGSLPVGVALLLLLARIGRRS